MIVFLVSLVIGTILLSLLGFYLYSLYLGFRYKHIRGPKPLPIIGNLLQLGTTPVEIKENLFSLVVEYDYYLKVHLGPTRIYTVLGDPKDLEVLLSSTQHIQKSLDYKFLHDWLGDGLLLSSGTKWKQRRRILTPAFHFSILEKFVDVFHKASNVFVNKLESEIDKPAFNIYNYVTLCALDIVCETAMGTCVNAQEKSESEYVSAVRNLCNITHDRMFSLPKQFECIFQLTSSGYLYRKSLKVLHDMTDKVIKQRRQELLSENEFDNHKEEDSLYGKKRAALLDILLRSTINGKSLTNNEIREEVDTFMFEGHDTVSSAIGFAIHELANDSRVQSKVYEEIQTILGNDKNKPLTYKDLQDMKYLELVIRETLRLYPSVPIIGRHTSQDMEINGKHIPAGYIAIAIYVMQRNPELYNDPDSFIPERFLEERYADNAFSFVPFSAGPRNCIGQKFAMLEMKSILSKIIQSYELLPGPNGRHLATEVSIIMKSSTGISISIKPRVHSK